MSKQKQIVFLGTCRKQVFLILKKMYCSLSFLSFASGHVKSLPKNICFANFAFLGKNVKSLSIYISVGLT